MDRGRYPSFKITDRSLGGNRVRFHLSDETDVECKLSALLDFLKGKLCITWDVQARVALARMFGFDVDRTMRQDAYLARLQLVDFDLPGNKATISLSAGHLPADSLDAFLDIYEKWPLEVMGVDFDAFKKLEK
jgi:hypothetical protein